MTSSLVGSEMCIRDRLTVLTDGLLPLLPSLPFPLTFFRSRCAVAVGVGVTDKVKSRRASASVPVSVHRTIYGC
eukprot:6493754-Prorocentrum_lima.AAC.1